jgi:hypothetical protein
LRVAVSENLSKNSDLLTSDPAQRHRAPSIRVLCEWVGEDEPQPASFEIGS